MLGFVGGGRVAAPSQFVSDTPMTVAGVLSTYPASATYVGKYARVTDLYGSSDEVLRCCMSSGIYYWRPQRTDYARPLAQTSGTVSLVPFVTAPQINLTSTLLGNMSIVPDSTNAWPGCSWDVTMQGLLGIFGATISGLLGTNVALLTGATRRIIWNGTGFYAQ